MEIKIDQLGGYMDGLFQKQDFETLKNIAQQVTQQRPEITIAWRYLGIIAGLSADKNCKKLLLQAITLGDVEAEIWLNVLNEFEYYPKNTVHPSHIFQQVYFMRLKRSNYMDFPTEVTFETQAICNAACTFCVYIQQWNEKATKCRMSLSTR